MHTPNTHQRFDAGWLANSIIEASLPDDLPYSRSVAVDGTDYETWGAFRHDPNATEAAIEAGEVGVNNMLIFGVDPDGRPIYTHDPTARGGRRSATNSRRGGGYVGYEVHLIVQVRDVTSTNYADKINLGPDVPPLVIGMSVVPAGAHRMASVVPLLRHLGRTRHLNEAIFDLGYTQLKPKTGYHPLRQAGIDLIFDLKSTQRGRRPFKSADLLLDGGLYSRHLPEQFIGIRQPDGSFAPLPRPGWNAKAAERRALEEAFNQRATWRLVRHQAPTAQGTTRWKCPFHGRLRRSRSFPYTMRYPHTVPMSVVNGDKCCDGIITVEAAELPMWQPYPFGTTAWQAAYSRRNVVEGVNGALQCQYTDISKGYHRVFGLEKVTMMLAFTVAGYNLECARTFRRTHDLPKPITRPARRHGTWDDLLDDGTAA
jgi:hypothetical protein